MYNSQFVAAVHSLGFLGWYAREIGDYPMPSEAVAESINTNPVVARRLLGSLRDAGLVSSQPGPGGGWRLTRQPEAITLREVFRAICDGPLFAKPPRIEDSTCPVGHFVHATCDRICREAQDAMEAHLAQTTLADVIAEVEGAISLTCPVKTMAATAS